ncbi:MAG: hypothetical protein A2W25_15190 [candidate division Zixibacteria bacterium RBG_16_53_22]|nr:MAG: hypothetical protein A2W25_15190 [candidate division Zixibacteria bacterium RBG_16_53_22]
MIKDPSAVKDYGFDWSPWMSSGDTISSSTFSADTLAVTSSSISSHTTICFIGSGSAGGNHKVTNRIVTAQGRTDERSFDMKIINL